MFKRITTNLIALLAALMLSAAALAGNGNNPDPEAPVITSTPVTDGVVGAAYSYDVEATGKPVPTFSLTTFPSGMTIDETTGVISWTPADVGNYDVLVVASNGVEPDAEQSYTITVVDNGGGGDITPPTVSITSPLDGATVSGTETITATAIDAGGIYRVLFFVDGKWKGTDFDSSYSYSWNTERVSDASHTIMVKAEDNAQNESFDSINVTVDNGGGGDITPPTVSITSPLDGATVSGTETITVAASDASGINRVEFYIDDSLKSTDNRNRYSYKWDTETVDDGSHVIIATAVDNAGNENSDSITVTVDNGGGGDITPPTVSITFPANGATVSGITTVLFRASDASGIDYMKLYIDGVEGGTYDVDSLEYYWNTVTVTNGSHTIEVKAWDNIGNSNPVSIVVTVDNDTTLPTVTITSPSNGATVSETITIAASASDAGGIDYMKLYIDGVEKGTYNDSSFSYSWNTTTYSNASHTIEVMAWDNTGNCKIVPIAVTVNNNDTTLPTVTITSPSTGITVSGTTTITASASDASGIDYMKLYIDGVEKATSYTASLNYSWNTTAYSSASHTIQVIAWDNAGNSNPVSIVVTVNNETTAPNVTINWPREIFFGIPAMVMDTAFPIIAVASDCCDYDASGIDYMKLYIDDVEIATYHDSSFTYFWNTTTYPNAIYSVRVGAWDNAGNSSYDEISAMVINAGPYVSINWPREMFFGIPAMVMDTAFPIIAVAGDGDDGSGIEYMKLYIDDVEIATYLDSSFTYFWNTTTYPNAIYSVRVGAWNNVGNSSYDEISAMVINPDPFNIDDSYTHLSSLPDAYEPYWNWLYRNNAFSHVDEVVQCGAYNGITGDCIAVLATDYHYRIPKFDAESGLWWQASYGASGGWVPCYYKTDSYGNVLGVYYTNWRWIIDEYTVYYYVTGDPTLYSKVLEKTIWPCERRDNWANLPTTNSLINASFVWISDGEVVDASEEEIVAFPHTNDVLGAVVGGGPGPLLGTTIDHRSKYRWVNDHWEIYISGSLTGGEAPMTSINNYNQTISNLNGEGAPTLTTARVVDKIQWMREDSSYPDAPIRIFGHSLGAMETIVIYNMRNTDGSSFLRAGDQVHAIAFTHEVPPDRLRQTNSPATFEPYLGTSDAIAGGWDAIHNYEIAGIEIWHVTNEVVWGHDRFGYHTFIQNNIWSWWPSW